MQRLGGALGKLGDHHLAGQLCCLDHLVPRARRRLGPVHERGWDDSEVLGALAGKHEDHYFVLARAELSARFEGERQYGYG